MILRNYPVSYKDKIIDKTINYRAVSLEYDLNMLHKWMQEPHVFPFWNLNISKSSYKEHLASFLNDNHQQLLIGEIDGIPMSYWESYMVKDDIIGKYYEFDDYDQGIHLLIGEREYLGKGYIYPLLLTLLKNKFRVEETKKIVAEPDIRNKKMIHIFQRCGFKIDKKVQLPDKEGLLLYCKREVFERRWKDWNEGKF
jgi:acetyl CoA:N6-hydroxylysine acetyl transferase